MSATNTDRPSPRPQLDWSCGMAENSLTERQRRCPDCGERKSLDAFWKDPTRRMGVQTYCIECVQDRKRRYAAGQQKLCKRCGETKPLPDFKKRKWARDSTASWCLSCFREYNRVNEAARRAASEARPLCGCGCGDQVKHPGAKFLKGHRVKRERVRPRAGDTDGSENPKKRERATKRTHKRCTKCQAVKPRAEFDQYTHRNPYGKPTVYCCSSCKSCAREAVRSRRAAHNGQEIERLLESGRRYREANKRARRSKALKKKFGITLEDYEGMHAAQGGTCAVCSRTDRPLVIDHCHVANRVRGLLCAQCNSALGLLSESVPAVEGLLAYLVKWRPSPI